MAHAPTAIVDGIFGTGLNAEVKGVPRRAIEMINALGVPAVAVDIASGVNADTGAVMGAAVRASITVTFGYAKFGHVSYPGAVAASSRSSISVSPRARSRRSRRAAGSSSPPMFAALIASRPVNSHKGMYGHPIVIAGGRGKSGAVLLASRAALRIGAGLVTAAVPESIQPIVAAGQAELMTEPIADRDGHFDAAHAPAALRMLLTARTR